MKSDRLVFWVVVVVVIGAWVAAALGMLGTGFTPILVAIGVTFLGALVAAVQFDRGRRRAEVGRYLDQNKPNLYAPMGNETWQVPTSYIDHRTGGGPPPGVETYDEERADRLTGRGATRSGTREDEAP